jgi:hypothetical protein
LVWMFHRTRTTALEDLKDSMRSDIATALVPINSTAWKTAQHLVKGRALARPSERSERFKPVVRGNNELTTVIIFYHCLDFDFPLVVGLRVSC